MARIIEFYVPTSFEKKETPQSDAQKGKVIEFCVPISKSAQSAGSALPPLLPCATS